MIWVVLLILFAPLKEWLPEWLPGWLVRVIALGLLGYLFESMPVLLARLILVPAGLLVGLLRFLLSALLVLVAVGLLASWSAVLVAVAQAGGCVEVFSHTGPVDVADASRCLSQGVVTVLDDALGKRKDRNELLLRQEHRYPQGLTG